MVLGPPWLVKNYEKWTKSKLDITHAAIQEAKEATYAVVAINTGEILINIIKKYS